ncbi:MAG: hypothetical protein IJF92_00820 [Bacilli bacterium]|nr:hypothetical protein [Bacilli bacterium]MBQ3307644.1 hypothetical protein [Bacilli bacterium]MBQ3423492.1 hypothetical protein [Romboutsia sp.]
MGNEETNNKDNELKTENGVFVDSIVDSLEIPVMTDEEADNREYENIEIVQEGGL